MTDFLKATDKIPSPFHFDGRSLKPGDYFLSDSPRMTKAMIALGFAELGGDTMTIDVSTIPSTPMLYTQVAAPPRKRGRPKGYKRRDMRAEG